MAPLAPERASSSSASPNVDKPASPARPNIPATSHATSPVPASSPAPKKTSSPAKDYAPPEQHTSAPDVHMDTGAQQDTSDTDAHASGAETAENAGAGDKSAGIDKGKNPEVPEVRPEPASASLGQATLAAPEKPASQTPAPEKSVALPAKTRTFKMTQIVKTGPSPAKTAPPPVKIIPTTGKTPAASSAMTLHTGKGAARISSFHTPELEGRVSLRTKSDKSLGSLKEHCMR
jgi:hypothetical protein